MEAWALPNYIHNGNRSPQYLYQQLGCRQRMTKLTCSPYSFFTILVSKQHLCGHLRGGRGGERGNGKIYKQQMSKNDPELKITTDNSYCANSKPHKSISIKHN